MPAWDEETDEELELLLLDAQDPSLYSWKSSNSSVVSVNRYGGITAKKRGKATITAKRKSDGKKLTVKVKVNRNKKDYLKAKPSASNAPYKKAGVRLKSIEIVSPNKVVVDYYLVCNFPSNWKLTKIKKLCDNITAKTSDDWGVVVSYCENIR